MIEEADQPKITVSYVARKYNVAANQRFKWRKLANEGKLCAATSKESVVAVSEVKKLKNQIRELERPLGRKALENEILNEVVEIARGKKLLLRGPLFKEEDIK